MSSATFSITKLNALRRRSSKARQITEEMCPEGWSKSPLDPAKLVALFTSLRVKPGFVLRAYQFRTGGNGNGVVWALPVEADFPDPDHCLRQSDRLLEPPKPLAALDDVMDVIEGDGTPWSYLSASLLKRELDEFGAMWHGCNWDDYEILGGDPWTPRKKTYSTESPSTPADQWKWMEPMPQDWRPRVQMDERIVTVTFFTYTGLEQEQITRHTDTFKGGSYKLETDEAVVGTGQGGYVH